MPDLAPLIRRNADRWNNAQLTREKELLNTAAHLTAPNAKQIYQDLQDRTGVPWFVIAVIHEREASQKFSANLAQGDPWNTVSVHVPKGRGPFPSFKAAAIDALTNCAPFAARWKDWTAGGALTLLEQYNGLGYFTRDLPSPYIWSGTDQYVSGKYVADGVFDPSVIDKQLGCAGLIRAMMLIDPTITFTGVRMVPRPAPQPQPVPARPSFWTVFLSLLASIFKRKP